jgi:signal transduction histidine kinase
MTFFAIVASTGNVFLGLPAITYQIGFAGAVCSGFVYYLSRKKRIFKQWLILGYSSMAFSIMAVLYIVSAGSYGTTIYLILMLLTVLLLMVPIGLSVWMSFLGIFLLIAGLLCIEYEFPEWIIPYRSEQERILDHLMGLLYYVFFITVVVTLFRRSYQRERNLVEQQNQDLLSLKAELEVSLQEKHDRNESIQLLLRELHHRVKNNLQVISSLLALQQSRLKDSEAQEALASSRNRIEAMALIST